MSTPKQFIKFTDWLLSHCLKEIDGKYCKDWDTDYCANRCKGIPFDMQKPKCTRFINETKI